MELIEGKMFSTATFSLNQEFFMIYIVVFSLVSEIHSFYIAHLVFFLADNAPTLVFFKYINFIDIFSPEFILKLSKYTRINYRPMNLIDDR